MLKTRRLTIHLAAITLAVATILPLRAVAGGTCAVLPFEGIGTDAAFQPNLDLLASRSAERVKASGAYKIQDSPRSKLDALGYYKSSYVSTLAAAMNAGLLLKVDHIVYGLVVKKGSRYTVTTTLVDVNQAQALRSIKSQFEGTAGQLVELVPESNIPLLMGTEPVATATAPAPAPAPAPRAATPVATTAATTAAAAAVVAATTAPPPPAVVPDTPTPDTDEPSLGARMSGWAHDVAGDVGEGWRDMWDGDGSASAKRSSGAPDFNPREYEGFTSHLADHLEIGTRMVFFSLEETSGEFIGTIDGLSEEQDAAPLKLFADWLFTPYVGVELTWDKIAGRSVTDTPDQHSDGVLTMSGPVIYAFGRYPFLLQLDRRSYIIAPYLGLGMAFFSSEFEEDAWWGLGYNNEAQWQAAGSPSTSNNGYTRRIDVDDSTGFTVAAGCAFQVSHGFSVDLYWRYIDAETDAVYTREREGIGSETFTGHFPMASTGYGLGIRYAF